MMLGSAMNLINEQLHRVSKYQFPPKSVSPMIFFEVFIGQRSIKTDIFFLNSTMKLLFISHLSETMEIPVKKTTYSKPSNLIDIQVLTFLNISGKGHTKGKSKSISKK